MKIIINLIKNHIKEKGIDDIDHIEKGFMTNSNISTDKIFVKMKNGEIKKFSFNIKIDEPLYGICGNIDYLEDLLKNENNIILGDVSIFNLEDICNEISSISFTRDERNNAVIKKIEGNSKFEKWCNLNFPGKILTNKNFVKKDTKFIFLSYFLYSPISVIKLLENEFFIEIKEYDSNYILGELEFYLFKSLYDRLKKFIIDKKLSFDDWHTLTSIFNILKKVDKNGLNSIIEFMKNNFKSWTYLI